MPLHVIYKCPPQEEINMAYTEQDVSRFLGGLRGFESGFAVTKLKGDASYRSYFRLQTKKVPSDSFILMQWDPALTTKSEEATGKTAITEFPFLNVQRYLENGGIMVPSVIRHDVGNGFILLQDLGDEIFERAHSAADAALKRRLYERAIKNLVNIQSLEKTSKDCIAFHRSFDYDLYMWEFGHFVEYCIEARNAGVPGTVARVPDEDRLAMQACFRRICAELSAIPKGFTHRDYQSRNLMLKDNRLFVIDFQDALQGPPQYDMVALLKDSYVSIDEPETEHLVEYFLDCRKAVGMPLDHEAFWRGFKLQSIQRKLKDAGRFVFIDRVKNNPSFLPSIPQSLAYVKRYLDELEDLRDFKVLLSRYVPELA
jgi:hypothetical protein